MITMYMGCYVEHARLTTAMDPQVYTHLLAQVEGLTSVISACERLLRTPIPLGYNIAISRIVWMFILGLPTQLWRELHWWSIPVTMATAYALFALAEVGLEIENVSLNYRLTSGLNLSLFSSSLGVKVRTILISIDTATCLHSIWKKSCLLDFLGMDGSVFVRQATIHLDL